MELKLVILVLILTFSVAYSYGAAPYQVSIRLKDLYQSSDQTQTQHHICNGIIIHEKYILTTAGCVHIYVMNTNFSRLLMAGEIYVVAGDTNSNDNAIQRNVVSIIPHNKFNKQTFDNDIAVLKLDRVIPLMQNTTEVQWIDIFNGTISNETCFATIFNYSVPKSSNPYNLVKNVSRLNNWLCDGDGIRKTDLCLEYLISAQGFCNVSTIYLKYSGERGTGYICNNKLVGILADINPPKNVEKCFSSQRTTAYYTNVANYYDWILTETGIANLGAKNKTGGAGSVVTGWISTTEAPVPLPGVKKSAAAPVRVSRVLQITLFLMTFCFFKFPSFNIA